ncbi:MAG: phosphate/phosphite/phosphonate ABC transporter substrate-binding protein [Synergistaceae bacterium]|nr:phosphate/phosphite/phosphonate ABC transporter substrate-binding protein [Synergistaceae bacterium]
MSEAIKVGAVIYDPKVTVIWGIIADFFKTEGMPIECVFYKDYTAQVDGLMAQEIDVAWNSPLAWLDSHLRSGGKCLYGAMRDTDRDRKTCFIAKKDSGIGGFKDLKGKTIGFGALDSPQARLIPIYCLHQNGLEYQEDYVEKRFDVGVGLHGDHVGGEMEALKALSAGDLDVSVALDLNWEAWEKDGTADGNKLGVIGTTDLFDHCIFVGREGFPGERFDEWTRVLRRMDYDNPSHRKMMDMEGLKRWEPGRLSGFGQLRGANEYLRFFS